MDLNQLKKAAAEEAVKAVHSGMVIGLGVGSTANYALRKIAALLNSGDLENIRAIPCSLAVEKEARGLGIPIISFKEIAIIDLTIDGADEVDHQLNMIKGGGGALLREKIVAQATNREIIVVDETKVSENLGSKWPIPIEVLPFGWQSQKTFLEELGARVHLRDDKDKKTYFTDQGNLILDADFGPIEDLQTLDQSLSHRVGILEHGLFIGLADELIVASQAGINRYTNE
jgi:ribose 5-phosphate isomerase A